MRMHSVSKMYTNFIYDMYINLFQKRYLANGLARKTKNSCTELLVTIMKRMVRIRWGYKHGWERQTSKI